MRWHWDDLGAPRWNLREGKLVAVLLFCLVNPFAGWAYLASTRAKWERAQAPLADTLKRKRLAVLPLLVHGGSSEHADAWLESMLSGLGGYEALETFAYPQITEIHRDPLALGSDIGADLVLDASMSSADGELGLFVRLLGVREASVLWSHLFSGTMDDLEAFRDETVLAVLRTMTTAS